MLNQIQYMQKNQVYRIKNRKTKKYLYFTGQEIVCTELIKGKIGQYWLCDEIKPTQYQIVSLQTGEVLTRNQKLTIDKGKWYSTQFWAIERAQIAKQANYFWVTAFDDSNKYLFASGADNSVSMKSLDRTLFVSNWQFQRIDDSQELSGCCVFKNQYSQMVIDVPQGSHKQGAVIIQYRFNGRGNQRWVLQKYKDDFIIRNLCSSMILCPKDRMLKQGNKIFQTQFTNNPAERWNIIPINPGQKGGSIYSYMLQNVGEPTLFIGVSSAKQCANLVLNVQKQKSLWILEGNLPPQFRRSLLKQVELQKLP